MQFREGGRETLCNKGKRGVLVWLAATLLGKSAKTSRPFRYASIEPCANSKPWSPISSPSLRRYLPCPLFKDTATMTDSDGADRQIWARDLVAYTDAELSRYLGARQLEGGGGAIAVEVNDPENLPETFIHDSGKAAINHAALHPFIFIDVR
jgi:hypothetical protein